MISPIGKPAGRPDDERQKMIAVAIFVGLVALCLAMCSGREASPPTLRTADSAVTEVEPITGAVRVDARIGVVSDESLALQVGMVVEALAKQVKAGATDVPADARQLFVRVNGEGADRLGNARDVRLAELRFPIGDLRAANYDGLDAYSILNLASDASIAPAAEASFATACAEQGGRLAEFCGKVR